MGYGPSHGKPAQNQAPAFTVNTEIRTKPPGKVGRSQAANAQLQWLPRPVSKNKRFLPKENV
jgi:hypothetical protein